MVTILVEKQDLPKEETAVSAAPTRAVVVGTLVEVDTAGVPRVNYPGNTRGVLVARVALAGADAARLAAQSNPSHVLIAFADADERQPVIVGVVRDTLADSSGEVTDWEGLRTLVLKAKDELILQCGDARIVLRRDGKLTVVGKEIVSRATGRHRIRGATVDIN